METTIVTDTDLAALLAGPSPVDLCKDFIVTQETRLAAEKHLAELKPQIAALRTGKETFFAGAFRNKNGKYKINHVESSQPFASVKVLEKWLEDRLITQAMYDEAVKVADKSYDLVTHKAS